MNENLSGCLILGGIFLTFLLVGYFYLFQFGYLPEVNSSENVGFLYGVLHGLTVFPNFLLSLFYDVGVYEWPNAGGWYDFGYVIGLSILSSSPSATPTTSKEK